MSTPSRRRIEATSCFWTASKRSSRSSTSLRRRTASTSSTSAPSSASPRNRGAVHPARHPAMSTSSPRRRHHSSSSGPLASTARSAPPSACCSRQREPGTTPATSRRSTSVSCTHPPAIPKPNVGKAAAMFDWDAVAERAGEGVEPGHSFLLRQVLRKLSARVFATSLSDSARAGDFQLLHVRTANGETTALMRLIMSNKSVNYYEMLLRRGDDGIVRAVDVYVFSSGAYTSEVFRE